jgi:hypothetical protein
MTTRSAHLAPEHNQGAVEQLVSPRAEAMTKLATTTFTAMERFLWRWKD